MPKRHRRRLAASAILISLACLSNAVLGGASLAPVSSNRPTAALPKSERALIVFDESSGKQHLVWELEPRTPAERSLQFLTFPTQPTVAALPAGTLDALAESYPIFPSRGSVLPTGRQTGAAPRPAHASGPTPTWRVFAPTDQEALRAYVEQEGYAPAGEDFSWVEASIAKGRHVVAVQLPPAEASAAPKPAPSATEPAAPPTPRASPTLRISFDAPMPFFPYAEQRSSAALGLGRGRVLSVWLIGARARSPMAGFREEKRSAWVRPWRETANEKLARPTLVDTLAPQLAALLPKAGEQLFVQRFVDQKSKRDGFGDVVLATRQPPDDAPTDEQLAAALRLLDPTLEVPR